MRLPHFSLIGCILLASIATPAAAAPKGSGAVVWPTGGDDTANVQAAFDSCEAGCIVQLEEGTFHIAQVMTSDFTGALRGRGRGLTILEALPNLRVNHATPWPWAAPPTPAAPWPVLLTFLGGDFSVSDLTVRIPGSPATEPWVNMGTTFELPDPSSATTSSSASPTRVSFSTAIPAPRPPHR